MWRRIAAHMPGATRGPRGAAGRVAQVRRNQIEQDLRDLRTGSRLTG